MTIVDKIYLCIQIGALVWITRALFLLPTFGCEKAKYNTGGKMYYFVSFIFVCVWSLVFYNLSVMIG